MKYKPTTTVAIAIPIVVLLVLLIANNLTGGTLVTHTKEDVRVLVGLPAQDQPNSREDVLQSETSVTDYGFMKVVPALIRAFNDTGLPDAIDTPEASGAPLGGGGINIDPRGIAGLGRCMQNKAIYDQAAAATGIPWNFLGALHFREGACDPNKSLISGRKIGNNEPDVVANGGCSAGDRGPGKPRPGRGGCYFNTLLDSALFAGNILKRSVGSRNPQEVAVLGEVFARYNGLGNRNCGSSGNGYPEVPYSGCPPTHLGEDHPYAYNKYDARHSTMYTIYCEDGKRFTKGCPRVDANPGALLVAFGLQLLTTDTPPL